ncbi:MAG: EF-hand domain-containing protein [Tabrizicola sp.]|nr:EF-hand domain-containing protein [Tabrizicola sp.]
MTRPKTALMLALFAGVSLTTFAWAETGPGGDDGHGHRGAKLLELFDSVDTDKDGKLSLAELEAHRSARFAAADTNGDGAIDVDELAAHELAEFQEKLAKRVQHMIDNKDNDGNGSLSADEIGKGPAEENFARIDTDNDGAISKEEAEAALKHRMKRAHGEAEDGN